MYNEKIKSSDLMDVDAILKFSKYLDRPIILKNDILEIFYKCNTEHLELNDFKSNEFKYFFEQLNKNLKINGLVVTEFKSTDFMKNKKFHLNEITQIVNKDFEFIWSNEITKVWPDYDKFIINKDEKILMTYDKINVKRIKKALPYLKDYDICIM